MKQLKWTRRWNQPLVYFVRSRYRLDRSFFLWDAVEGLRWICVDLLELPFEKAENRFPFYVVRARLQHFPAGQHMKIPLVRTVCFSRDPVQDTVQAPRNIYSIINKLGQAWEKYIEYKRINNLILLHLCLRLCHYASSTSNIVCSHFNTPDTCSALIKLM